MKRKNLVIVRAGNSSLHPHWLEGAYDRNWDLVVSYFGDDPNIYRIDDVVRIDAKGPKWPPIYSLLESNPSYFSDYEYIWLPDDDILTSKQNINRMFDLCREYGLEVAQPALTWDSYFSHLLTLRCAKTCLRRTNFVEIMAPCLSAGVLAKTYTLFKDTMSGYGIDFLWPAYVNNRKSGIGIIDEVSVKHTRPVGGPNYANLKKAGITTDDEFSVLRAKHNIPTQPIIEVLGAVFKNKTSVLFEQPSPRISAQFIWGYICAISHTPDKIKLLRRIVSVLIKSLFNEPDKCMDLSFEQKLKLRFKRIAG